jgi:CRP-like cAMP-binding protein
MGQVVFSEGATADSLLFLAEGQLKVSIFSPDGSELLLSMVFPGETIGELGMLSATPRSATVTAIRRSRALTLSRSVVMELIEERPSVGVAMLRQLVPT